MGTILSSATVRVLDPFDDDEDDDEMRRLCGSPVLFPDNTIQPSIQSQASLPVHTVHAQALIHSDVVGAAGPKDSPQDSVSRVGRTQEAVSVPITGYVVPQSHTEALTASSSETSGRAQRPNQPVNRSVSLQPKILGETAGDKEENPLTSSVDVNSSPDQISTQSFKRNIASHRAAQSHVSAPVPPEGTKGKSLADRIARLELLCSRMSTGPALQSVASPVLAFPGRNAPSVAKSIASSTAATTKPSTLAERIAHLESLLLGSDSSTPSSGVSDSVQSALGVSPSAAVQLATPSVRDSVPQPKHQPTPLSLHLNAQQSHIDRRNSSASSESYEPASPTHSVTPDLEEFAPGEFVLSPDELMASASRRRPPGLQHNARPDVNVQKKLPEEAEQDRDDIPHFTSSMELPPNMPVPSMVPHNVHSSRNRAPIEPVRAQALAPPLRHPQPRRGASTPTASLLEETAAVGVPSAVDLTVEYEEEPMDIAARNIKPRLEQVTKVKFAEADLEGEEEVEDNYPGSTASSDSGSPIKASKERIHISQLQDEEQAPQFKFEETDILKGLSMPSLSRRYSQSLSGTSDSDSQPESPAENHSVRLAPPVKSLAVEQVGLPSAVTVPAPAALPPSADNVARPASEASSRSASPESASGSSDSSASGGLPHNVSAASKMSAPQIRVGGSLMKRDGRKPGFAPPYQQRSSQRYGMHAGYSGPKRNFRTFEDPSPGLSDSNWRDSSGAPYRRTAVHTETAYDIAQQQGGNVALASYLDKYETPLDEEISSKEIFMDVAFPDSIIFPRKSSLMIVGASKRRIKRESIAQEQSELDIFDELLGE